MKKIAGRLKLDLAQYRELEAFAKLGTDLDKATQAQLDRGEKLIELLKQPQYKPQATEDQVAVLYAANSGALIDIPTTKIAEWAKAFVDLLARQARRRARPRSRLERSARGRQQESPHAALAEFNKGF